MSICFPVRSISKQGAFVLLRSCRQQQLLLSPAASSTISANNRAAATAPAAIRTTSLLGGIRYGHTVRIILKEDVEVSKMYKNEIKYVKAGYARNYLIPKKFAVYATRENFKKMGLKDPELETAEERRIRLQQEAMDEGNQDLKAADTLKRYLSNKVLRIWRNVDKAGEEYNAIAPGMVDAKAIRDKLSKQLKIDLEPHEQVHVRKEAVSHELLTDEEIEKYMEELGDDIETPCTTQIKHLGEYLARISLRGGYQVPLKFIVQPR